MSTTPPVLWTPSPERVERAAMTAFRRRVADEHGVEVPDYEALWRWSVADPDTFWGSVWSWFDVQHDGSADPVLGVREMPHAEWFPRAQVNLVEHFFRDRDDDAVALHHASELRPEPDTWTWGRLREEAGRIAEGLRRLGVGPGDRVAAYMPNIPETLAAFVATASLGATWSSCSPDFGTRTVVDRFAQIEPKVLLAVDGYRYGGKDFDRRDVVRELRAEITGVEHLVVLPYLGSGEVDDALSWDDLRPADVPPLTFTRVPFAHPLWVLYSSGTTGLPKPIVHGHGGILLESLKKHHLHLDCQEGDRVLWFTTTGWMMWNFLACILLTRAEIVLFDGNPGHPDLGTLWDLAERTGTTTFGCSAAYISACMKAGVHPSEGRDLSAITAVGSTGSPLPPEGFQWVYDEIGEDTWLFSTSGGTDVCTAFVGGVPTLPVHLGELQARSLGCAVEAWDDEGRPLVGEVGELVITQPMPSMPVGFWGDSDGSRYRDSYFTHYDVDPPVWRHGDWIEITEHGTAVIYGRSDSTINRGGIRMGTSEIYRAVLAVDEILDALVVDVSGREGFPDGWMPLFVVLREGVTLDDDLVGRIARRVRSDCSPRHVPDEVHVVAEIPRTLSGKILEVPVKRVLMGQPVEKAASRDSLVNPAALDWFVEFARAQGAGGV